MSYYFADPTISTYVVFSSPGSDPAAQGSVSVAVPRAAGVLRGAVPGEGRHPHRAGHQGAAQVLAQDLLPEGGHVPGRDRGDT